jgi:hypothetical protein
VPWSKEGTQVAISEIVIYEVDPASPMTPRRPDGTVNAIPVSAFVKALGGFEGYIADPSGDPNAKKVFVSVKMWEHRDLDNTFLNVKWKWVDPALVGTVHPGFGKKGQ